MIDDDDSKICSSFFIEQFSKNYQTYDNPTSELVLSSSILFPETMSINIYINI